jgi:hypothetical protein
MRLTDFRFSSAEATPRVLKKVGAGQPRRMHTWASANFSKIEFCPFDSIVRLRKFSRIRLYTGHPLEQSALIWRPRVTEVRHWIGISTLASSNILLPVQPEVTLKVIWRSNIDIILKIQHFEGRFQRAGPMTLKVTLKVTGVNFGLIFWTLAHMCWRHKTVKIRKSELD